MKNVLVTAIGSASADIVISELKNSGYKVVGSDIYPREWVANALEVDVFYHAPRVTNQKEYLSFVQKVCVEENIQYVFPLTDVEVDVYNGNRKWFEEKGVTVCISSFETISLCRNKKLLGEFIDKNHLVKTIPTFTISEIGEQPESLPVVCKPFDGRSSEGLERIYDLTAWENFKKKDNLDRYIIQPLIEGNVVTVDVVRQPDGVNVVAVSRVELLRTLNGLGTSVHIFLDSALEKQCIELANKLQVVGCVNFEFIKDDKGDYHFLECNPRFSGGVKFSCMAGYNCVKNHLKAYETGVIDAGWDKREMYIARKYQEYVTQIN